MYKFNVYDVASDVTLATITDLQGPREVARTLDLPAFGWISDRARGEVALILADYTGGSITLRQANRSLGALYDLGVEAL